MHTKCLRTIARAFLATPIPIPKAEAHTAPIDNYLDQLQAKARHGLRVEGSSEFIAKTFKALANKVRGKADRKRMQ